MTKVLESLHTSFLRYEKVSEEWVAVIDTKAFRKGLIENDLQSHNPIRICYKALVDRRNLLRDTGQSFEVSEEILKNWPSE